MKVVAATRITHLPDPITGKVMSTTDRLREVVHSAVRAEELGFDGFGVEERHDRPFISSPPVVLSHIAARTSVIRLFTAITAGSLLDPVRVCEDYSTLDHLSGGRLELIIGEGSGTAPAKLSRVTAEDQGDRGDREACELFRRLWHGSATSADSADLAARLGDPLFLANVSTPVETCAELVRYYRERWEFYRRDPGAILIGAGTAGYYCAPTSQQAIQTYRPIYNARQVRLRGLGLKPAFCSLEDAIERGSILVGSPQQITDQVRRCHERLGHEVLHLHADADGLTQTQHRRSQELFFDKIAPVLRRDIPSRPFPQAPAALSPVRAPLGRVPWIFEAGSCRPVRCLTD